MNETRQGIVRRALDMLPCLCELKGETCETCNKIYTQILANTDLRALIFNSKKEPKDIKDK